MIFPLLLQCARALIMIHHLSKCPFRDAATEGVCATSWLLGLSEKSDLQRIKRVWYPSSTRITTTQTPGRCFLLHHQVSESLADKTSSSLGSILLLKST